MAKSAAIGNLFVNLGLNSAEFSTGLKAAQSQIGKFSKAVSVGFAAAAAAATAAAGGIAFAVKGAIDHADELGKTAQKIGLSVEALSRLEYAAKLSDVSLEGLSTGLRKFSQEIVAGSMAFGALGIAIKDSSGNLRGTDALLADVADRFARMEDGATKTALAVQLFGRAGADLIPLLNGGRDGLAAMAAESDRLGATISTSTSKAAEQFNDTITRVQATLGGVTNKIMEAALPALQSLADTIASPQFAAAAQQLATWLVGAFDAVVKAVIETTNAISGFMSWLQSLDSKPGAGAPLVNGLLPGEKLNLADRIRARTANPTTAGELYAGFGFGADGKMNVEQPKAVASFVPVIEGAKAAQSSVTDLMKGIDDAKPKVESFAQTVGQTMADAFSGFADAVLSGVNPLQALGDELANIGKQLVSSAISGFFGNLFGGFGGPAQFVGRGFGAYGMYASGGIADRPSIFGEAGPEAAVPLPDGRTIPVTFTNGGGGSEVLIRLDQGLVAQILKQADSNAVKVVDSRAPAAVARTQRNGGL